MWTAPEGKRLEGEPFAGERSTLEGFLEWQRSTFLLKCAGLTAEQLCQRSVPSTDMTLMGLVRHLSEVERAWFRLRLLDLDLPYLYWRPTESERPDEAFAEATPGTAEADYAIYLDEVVAAREAAATRDLDFTFVHSRTGETFTLRWVYVHMIEEYARHNGHADLLREAIDGATGE